MAKLEILTAPDPRLKQLSQPVDGVDDEIRQLMDDMLESMYAANGIGLAAPQVGVLKRVIVVDIRDENDAPRPLKLANPELTWVSDHDSGHEEGCLSVPEHYGEVVRPAAITVRYLDEQGAETELEADGLLATCIQHEIDHLDGILFVDHLTALKRNMILRKLLKAKKQTERDAKKSKAKESVPA